MIDRASYSDRFLPLLNAACDGELLESQLQELESILDADIVARKEYADHFRLKTDIRLLGRAERLRNCGLSKIKATLPNCESSLTCVASSLPVSTPNLIHGAFTYISSGWPLAYLIATVIFGVAAVIGTFTYVSRPEELAQPASVGPKKSVALASGVQEIGMITGMVRCKWSDSCNPPASLHVTMGQRFALTSGLVEIEYATGAKVILQGPVTYEADSRNGGYLSFGKLTGKVEIAAAKGFAVRTPSAVVTDLGTEFSIDVDGDGRTISYVFRGSVRVQAIGRAESDSRTWVLGKREGIQLDRRGVVTTAAPVQPNAFVRSIPRPTTRMFDLVDVVAGGDGYSRLRGKGIDATTGRIVSEQPSPFLLDGDHKYHRVDELPFVDGVFVPNGAAASVQINSNGQTFADFPATTGKTSGHLWAGGVISFPDPPEVIPVTLGGVDYSSSEHGVLFLHANKGVTFDLEAIRRANPECKITRFLSAAGDTENYSKIGKDVRADLWVFIDDSIAYRRCKINSNDGAYYINIPISDNNRFLTLAATDGGDGGSCDWIIFGDPRLELRCSQPSAIDKTPEGIQDP